MVSHPLGPTVLGPWNPSITQVTSAPSDTKITPPGVSTHPRFQLSPRDVGPQGCTLT